MVEKRDIRFCPEPTVKFNIGDEVQIGNLLNCVITDVSDDGKVYTVDYDREEKDGYQKELRHYQGQWCWYEILDGKNSEEDHGFIKNKDCRLNYSQRSVEGLLNMIYHFGVDTSPEYQRDYVWTVDDQRALIDSIFNGVDIGKFVFVHIDAVDGYWYEILDGKQRLKALADFYENRFDYKGVFYRDLSKAERCYFRNYEVSYADLQGASEELKFRTFILLNTRGISVEQAHLDEIKKLYEARFGKL